MKPWIRETRLQTVDKAVFPSLLEKLWKKVKPSNAAAGFTGRQVHPVDREKAKKRVIHTTLEEGHGDTADVLRHLL